MTAAVVAASRTRQHLGRPSLAPKHARERVEERRGKHRRTGLPRGLVSCADPLFCPFPRAPVPSPFVCCKQCVPAFCFAVCSLRVPYGSPFSGLWVRVCER